MENKYDKNGINKNTYKLLFKDKYLGIKNCNSENEKIMEAIKKFTMINDKNIFYKLLKLCNLNASINNIYYDKKIKQYVYKDKNIEITFDKLINKLHPENPEELKKLQKNLYSNRREHKCHQSNAYMASCIPKANIITGYEILYNLKYLHTICEYINYDGKIIIVDWTKNLVMEKQDYIRLTNFVELSSISEEEYLTDSEMIKTNFPNLGMKAYLIFRDELVRDILKNKIILNYDGNFKNSIEEFKQKR